MQYMPIHTHRMCSYAVMSYTRRLGRRKQGIRCMYSGRPSMPLQERVLVTGATLKLSSFSGGGGVAPIACEPGTTLIP